MKHTEVINVGLFNVNGLYVANVALHKFGVAIEPLMALCLTELIWVLHALYTNTPILKPLICSVGSVNLREALDYKNYTGCLKHEVPGCIAHTYQ